MTSERLITDLVADLRQVRQRSVAREGFALALLGGVELGLYLLLGYARPDLETAMALSSFWWKLASLGLLSVVGAITALHSFDPVGSSRQGLRLLAVMLGVTIVVGWLIEGKSAAGDGLTSRLMWRHGIDCVVAMTTLSIPALVTLALLMRRSASVDPRGSALAAGIASAAWGAFVFVFNCPHDDPLYIAVWYVIGSAMVVLAGRLILPLVARW